MGKLRRKSTASLLTAPLDFTRPLAERGLELRDAVLLAELPGEDALIVWRTFRLLTAWLAAPEGRAEEAGVAEWEESVLRHTFEDGDLWAPLGVLAYELASAPAPSPEEVGKACWALADWAVGRGSTGTALLFAEAAAEAFPTNARYAWLAGRLLKQYGRHRDAERWLLRAKRVAVWHGDWHTQGLALNSLGTLRTQTGEYSDARSFLEAALRVARRKGLRELQGQVLHDLFVVATYSGKHQEAENLAERAFVLYGPGHPNLATLACDVGYLWLQQGYCARSLRVIQACLPRFQKPSDRLRPLIASARAAGAIGDVDTFWCSWNEAWEILDRGEGEALRSSAALELGFGALNLSFWQEAAYALGIARDTAELRREDDNLARADAALDKVRRGEKADLERYRDGNALSNRPAEIFARELIQSVGDEPSRVHQKSRDN